MKPNPSLHAIDQAPFYAVKIVPGDLGTKGGLVTDERARVLRPDGSVIDGPVRRRQRLVRGDGPHLRRPRRHHRPGAGLRLPRRRGHRAGLVRRSQHAQTATEGDRLMPIDPSVAIGADLGQRTFSWSVQRRPALPPRHRRRRRARATTSTRPRCAGPPTAPGQQVLPSFGVVAPTFHETDPPSLDMPGCDINLAQVVHGSQAITVHAPLPTSGTATLSHDAHRHLGQGQGRGDLAGGRRHLRRRRGRCGPPAPRSSSAARAAGAATAAPRSRSSCPTARPTPTRPTPSRRSRRCSTASAATATRCTPTPASPRRPASRRRSCTGSAPTASCCASSPTRCSAATRPGWRGFAAKFSRRGLPRRDAPGAGLARGRPDRRLGHRRRRRAGRRAGARRRRARRSADAGQPTKGASRPENRSGSSTHGK